MRVSSGPRTNHALLESSLSRWLPILQGRLNMFLKTYSNFGPVSRPQYDDGETAHIVRCTALSDAPLWRLNKVPIPPGRRSWSGFDTSLKCERWNLTHPDTLSFESRPRWRTSPRCPCIDLIQRSCANMTYAASSAKRWLSATPTPSAAHLAPWSGAAAARRSVSDMMDD